MVNFESIKGSNTQVAFHPQPRGVIQFVVGFILVLSLRVLLGIFFTIYRLFK